MDSWLYPPVDDLNFEQFALSFPHRQNLLSDEKIRKSHLLLLYLSVALKASATSFGGALAQKMTKNIGKQNFKDYIADLHISNSLLSCCCSLCQLSASSQDRIVGKLSQQMYVHTLGSRNVKIKGRLEISCIC